MKNIVLALLVILSQSAFGQSIRFFDVDTTDFPVMRVSFYAFDLEGNIITNYNADDFSLTENESVREILSVSCPEHNETDAISSVLTIDVSGSMAGGRIDMAKEAVKAWINAMPVENSECAITSFNNSNNIIRDFTNDRDELLDKLESLKLGNGTDYDEGLLNPMTGGLHVAKTGQNKKVLVFLTDGSSVVTTDEAQIIEEATANDIAVYSVILGMDCPLSLQNISEQTGGRWFDNVNTTSELHDIYMMVLQIALGNEACEINWNSAYNCNDNTIFVNIENIPLQINTAISYEAPENSIAYLSFTPPGIYFYDKAPGMKYDTTITVTANNADFDISEISSSNPAFSITPSTFTLNAGESKELTIGFTPEDSNYTYTEFNFVNDLCTQQYFISSRCQGSWGQLLITQPMANETFVVGNDTTICWEGISPGEEVLLEYSFDKGDSWRLISNDASGLSHRWENIPKTVSNECLIKISQFDRNGLSSVSPQIEWQKCLGGTGNEYPSSIRQTLDSGYIIAGYTETNDGSITGQHGGQDFWVVKLNKSGEVEWENCYGGTDRDYAQSIKQTTDNGYIVAGCTYSKNGDVIGNHGNKDGWIIKLNIEGDIEWQKCLGGSDYDGINSILQTTDGGYILTGDSGSDDGDVSGNHGAIDLWLVKLDNSGELEWQKCLGGSQHESGSDIQQTDDNGYIIAGHTSSSDFRDSSSSELPGQFFIKIDSMGGVQWLTTDHSIDGGATSIQQTGDGMYISTGGNSDFEKTFAVIMKLDTNGTILWKKSFSKTRSNARGILETIDNGFLIAGYYSCNDSSIAGHHGYGDFWLFKMNSYGEVLWQKFLGGSQGDGAYSLEKTMDGGYIMSGITESNDGDVSGNHGGTDFWIVKLSPEGEAPNTALSDSTFSIVMPEAESHNIDMGSVVLNEYKDSLDTGFITNTGSWDFRIDSIYIRGSDKRAFQTVSEFPDYTVVAGASHPADFRFKPNKIGLHEAEIVIITQADTLIQNITGIGVEKRIDILSEIIDFGLVELSKDTLITTQVIENISDEDIEITEVKMLGPDKEQFEIADGGEAFTLAAGGQHELSLRFTPQYIGRVSGQIGFYFDGPGSPATVQLYGEGIEENVGIKDEMISTTGQSGIIGIYPNPAEDMINIDLFLAEETQAELILCNSLGIKIQTIINEVPINEKQTINIPTTNLSSGTYVLLLKTPSGMKSHSFMIVR